MITWQYDNTKSPLPELVMRQCIARVLEEWGLAGPRRHKELPQMVEVAAVPLPDISISWEGTHPRFLADSNIAALCHHRLINGRRYARVLLNERVKVYSPFEPRGVGKAWRWLMGTNIFVPLAHELGHALGLRHNERRGSIMAHDIGNSRMTSIPQADRMDLMNAYRLN